jgi:glycosyltransferase involved in cell wall biosynthesis
MRILLLSQFYPPIIGGEERHVRNLGAALVQRGHTVSVATQWTPLVQGEAMESDGEVRVHRIRGSLQRIQGLFTESDRRHAPPFPDPELATGLKRIVKDEQPDVVHAHNWMMASFLPMARWSRAGLVATLHDYGLVCPKKNLVRDGQICAGPQLSTCLPCTTAHYGTRGKAWVTMAGSAVTRAWALRRVDRFIAVSHAVARHNRLAELGARFEVIPNFVPNGVANFGDEPDPRLQQLPGDGYILFVGDLMRLKGIDVLLEAYSKLAGAPALVLIGRRCHDTPTVLPPNVHVLSMWPHGAIMQAWRRCLFAVAPSTGPEACATVVMEAMASGKPVIATDIGGMPDLIDDGLTGALVPPGDAAALASAMRRLLDDRELLVRMGAASLVKAEQLKAGSVVPRIERVYRDVRFEKQARRRRKEYAGEQV